VRASPVLLLLLSAPSFASAVAPGEHDRLPGCGEIMAIGFAGNAFFTGLLLAPAFAGDDREVRVSAGAGASERTNIVTGGDPAGVPGRLSAIDAQRATLIDVVWSAIARRRIAGSRFQYHAWSNNLVSLGGCTTHLESSSRLVSGFGFEVVRGSAAALELGVGLQHVFNTRGQAVGFDRALFGPAPFVRLTLDPPESFAGFEAVAFYFLGANGRTVQHAGQLDLTVLYRLSKTAITATIRGELGHSEHGVFFDNTLLKLSSSVLLGVRM